MKSARYKYFGLNAIEFDFLQRCLSAVSNFVKIRPLGADLLTCAQIDERKDVINKRFSRVKVEYSECAIFFSNKRFSRVKSNIPSVQLFFFQTSAFRECKSNIPSAQPFFPVTVCRTNALFEVLHVYLEARAITSMVHGDGWTKRYERPLLRAFWGQLNRHAGWCYSARYK
jgi:hypothetical protein